MVDAVTHSDNVASPLKVSFDANHMSCGKTLIITALEHLLECELGKHGVPKGGPWGPCIVICQADLVKTSASAVYKPFKGLLQYYIASCAFDLSPTDGINVLQSKDDFIKFQDMIYKRRFDPEVMKMTVFMSYHTMKQRFLHNTTFMTLQNEEEIDLGNLPWCDRPSPMKTQWVTLPPKSVSESHNDSTAVDEDGVEDDEDEPVEHN